MSYEARRHADLSDRASELERMRTQSLLAQANAAAAPEQRQRPDGTWPQTECEDCGGEIEAGRLALGRIRCFGCQSALEKRRRR